jgi:uncharacterized protein YkwD
MLDAIDAINVERVRLNLDGLRFHPALQASAQAHSLDMGRSESLSHQGTDGSSPFDRMKAAGYNFSSAGECVAEGQTTSAEVVSDWLEDPPHRQILLNPTYRHIGVASSSNYWTADLACGEPDPSPPPNPLAPISPSVFVPW